MEDKDKFIHELKKELTENTEELRLITEMQKSVYDKLHHAANNITEQNLRFEIQQKYADGLEEHTNELKFANDELHSKNKELVKINKELEAFAYISSHDLQEPLRKIQTFSNRILEKEKDKLSLKGQKYFSKIQDSAYRMQTLIEDLLAFSKLTLSDMEFVNTDLGSLINEVKEEFHDALNKINATIEIPDGCRADIVRFQFYQLLHNLISNAIKFRKTDESLRIEIKSYMLNGNNPKPEQLLPGKEYCHISVKDNGIGFDEEFSEKIFEVFQKLHGKDEYPGTGIGLATVKKIVDNHNGFITATSEVNKGTSFDIYIPSQN